MEKIRNWLLPGVIAAAQLALWPFEAQALEQPPGTTAWLTALLATALAVLALERRRRAPLVALAGTLTASVLVKLLAPPDTLALVSGVAVPVALYSVAGRCGVATTVRAVAAACAVQISPAAARYGFSSEWLADVSLTVGSYLVIAAVGVGRRQWLVGAPDG
jgi:hypothetical protein